jgi:hypothetical protein
MDVDFRRGALVFGVLAVLVAGAALLLAGCGRIEAVSPTTAVTATPQVVPVMVTNTAVAATIEADVTASAMKKTEEAMEDTDATSVPIGDTPSSVTVELAQPVVWRNDADVSLVLTAGDGYFSSGVIEPGATYTSTFLIPGETRVTASSTAGEAVWEVQVVVEEER